MPGESVCFKEHYAIIILSARTQESKEGFYSNPFAHTIWKYILYAHRTDKIWKNESRDNKNTQTMV